MTFCVSHQKQPDIDPTSDASDANQLVADNDIDDDALRHHENGSVRSTESTNLGEHEKQFIDDIELSREDSRRQFLSFVCVFAYLIIQ